MKVLIAFYIVMQKNEKFTPELFHVLKKQK